MKLPSFNFRIDLLSFSLEYYVEKRMICYFPGKFIDEAFRLLQLLQPQQPLGQATWDLTSELEDLKVMAEEHFEKVLNCAG